MAHKLWLETRAVFLGVAAFLLAMVALYAWLPVGAAEWDARLHRLFFAWALATVVLTLHAFNWMHGHAGGHAQPLLFTLSLPISRRRLVLHEAAMGLTQSAVLVTGCCALLWALSPSLRAVRDAYEMAAYLGIGLLSQLFLYSLGVLLATSVPLLWPVYCLATVSAFQWQLGFLQAWGGIGLWTQGTGRAFLPFALAHPMAVSAASLCGAAAALYLAALVFERRDF